MHYNYFFVINQFKLSFSILEIDCQQLNQLFQFVRDKKPL